VISARLETELRAFVEAVTGGRVARLERTAMGSSRVTLLVDVEGGDGERRELVLRHDSGDGPLSGTDIDLAHEAVFYRALASQRVRIPRLLAEAPDGRTLLVERAPGSEGLAELSESDREAVERDFGRALAELHAVDPAPLPLGDLPRPESAADHARIDLRRWDRFLRENVEKPSRVSRLASDWLDANAPTDCERTVLCHGDAGVGNFLHADGRVTALLDWEFAHLGDPLDDIAWVLVRSHVTGGDVWHPALETWSERSGLTLDRARVTYYRALVLLRMSISCQIALGRAARGSAMDTTIYEMLLPYLGWLLPQALREAGCREAELVGLEQEAKCLLDAHPVLKAVARPLVAWEPPR
jgi:aminoglycoside phosphotransferase (APT) family kinase protein